jgi:hypothetical protein
MSSAKKQISVTVSKDGPYIFGWTLVLLVYLIVIGVAFYFIDPSIMRLH